MYLVFKSRNTGTLFPILYWKEGGRQQQSLLQQTVVYYRNPDLELVGVVDSLPEENQEKTEREKELEEEFFRLQQELVRCADIVLETEDEDKALLAKVKARALESQIRSVLDKLTEETQSRRNAYASRRQDIIRKMLKPVPAGVAEEIKNETPIVGGKEIVGFVSSTGTVITGKRAAELYRDNS